MSTTIPSVLMFTAAVVLCHVASSAPIRPPTITMGYYHNAVDPLTQYDAVQLYVGLKAAEKAINDADALLGTTLDIKFISASPRSASNASRLAAAQAALDNNNLFGFILPDWFTSHDIYPVTNWTVPVVGARTLTVPELLSPWRHVTAMRQSSDVWHRVMVHNAMHDASVQCSSFLYVTRNYFTGTISQVLPETLRFLNASAAVHIDLGDPTIPVDTSAVLEQWLMGDGSFTPMCGLFFTSSADIVAILGAMYADTRFVFDKMTFYSTDFAIVPTTTHATYGTAPFKRLRFVSSFPDPLRTNLALSVNYRAAVAALLGSGFTLPAGLQAAASIDTEPNLIGLEGYMTGIVLFEFLKRMPTITRSAFLDVIYDTRYFWAGDVILGPFMDHCLIGTGGPMPCWCNVVITSMFIATVDPTTAKVVFPSISSTDRAAYELTKPSSECIVTDPQLFYPIRFHIFSPRNILSTGTATAANSLITMLDTLQQNCASLNTAQSGSPFMLSAGSVENFLSAAQIANDSFTSAMVFKQLHAQRAATVMIGDWFTPADLTTSVINLVLPPSIAVADPEVTSPPTLTSANTWKIKPTIADTFHALSQFLNDESFLTRNSLLLQSPAALTTFVVGTSAAIVDVMTLSLHTIQVPVSHADVVDFSSSSSAMSALRLAINSANSNVPTLLALATDNQDAAVNVLSLLLNVTGWFPSASSLAVSRYLVVVVSCDTRALFLAKMSATVNGTVIPSAASLPFPIYFATYLYPFFETANARRAAAASLFGSSSPVIVEDDLVHLGMLITDTFNSALLKLTTNRPKPEDILAAVNAEGRISVDGVTLGPFYADNCTSSATRMMPSRKCECQKVFRTFRVYDFRGWMRNSAIYNPAYEWSLPGCAPEYSPLRMPAASVNIVMIVGIAVPLGACALAALLVVSCCLSGRNNRSAPKDPSKPFAMVFTDIQSSTALWARAPSCMGAAIDMHHAMLRELIAKRNGYEVKTIGDSFMVAFRKASDAAQFALDIQTEFYNSEWPTEIDETYINLALEALEEQMEVAKSPPTVQITLPTTNAVTDNGTLTVPITHETGSSNSSVFIPFDVPTSSTDAAYLRSWNGIRVRVGLHWGMGSIKLDPVSQGYDYYGTVVNTAARVEGVGNGGQVLCTRDFFVQLEEESFSYDKVSVECLGPQPLRGLDQPIPLYQLCPESLKSRVFAPLRLDKEVGADDETEESSAAETTADDSIASSMDGYLDRLLKPIKNGAALRPLIQRYLTFVETMLQVPPAAWRKDTVKSLLKHWHVRSHHHDKDSSMTMRLDLAALAVRVGIAAEEASAAHGDFLPPPGRRSLAPDTQSRNSEGQHSRGDPSRNGALRKRSVEYL